MGQVKILVAGDPASIHANRFINLLQEIGYDVRMFQSEHYYSLEEHLKNTVVYVSRFQGPPKNGNVLKTTYPFEASYDLLTSVALKIFWIIWGWRRSRVLDLVKVIGSWKPDIVFSLKMQNDGYTVSDAKEILKEEFKPKWVHFNWGTDIEFFGKHMDYVSEHLPKIKKVLSLCDFHMADCKRDVRQAVEFGFTGTSLGDCLATGGFDIPYLQTIRSANNGKRDIIIVKGREGGLVGKAFHVLSALRQNIPQMKDFKIKIIMASPDMITAARDYSRRDGVEYEIMPQLPYEELLSLFAKSRIAVSASDVDGTPSFLIEAMALGAFPIHSDMESVREWIQHGVNGLLFPVDNINALSECIQRALNDDRLVQSAQIENWKITQERMDRKKIREHLRGLIQDVVLKNPPDHQ